MISIASNTLGAFTTSELDKYRELFPSPIGFRSVITKPEYKARLERDIIMTSEVHTAFGCIKIYCKPNQMMDAWIISDPEIERKYLAGEISELDLVRMMKENNKIACARSAA